MADAGLARNVRASAPNDKAVERRPLRHSWPWGRLVLFAAIVGCLSVWIGFAVAVL
ncbi:hypothetical protein [Consotaella aegiceratis]|uniref:hypothetical protein n=1 Tax=Consotaella aegiceratis TaxID=3097961 RepID=UPI002F3FCDAA